MDTKQIFALFAVFLFTVMIGKVYHTDVATPGEPFEVFTTFYNDGNHVEDQKISLYIPSLDVYYRSNTFEMSSRGAGGKYLLPYIPSDAANGWHRMWVMVSGENNRDWDFSWVYVG